MTDQPSEGPPAIFAWLVHLFTASGALIALFALLAVERGEWRLAMLWLFLALVVDGIDGTFARWAREAIDEGDPVLAGVKIVPTAHPEWGLDHFVLVVGHGSRGLLVNTTWGHRAWIGPKTSQGLSLERAFYGLRLRREAGSPRLTVIAETSDAVELRVHCANGERQVTVDARALTRLHCAR